MRAFAVQKFGDAPALHDIPIPAVDGAFLVRVHCAGVNPVDAMLVDQLTLGSPYPFVLGVDFAGVAERVPAGQDAIRSGDRVFGMAWTHGAYAEYTASVPTAIAEPIARIPDGVTDEQAATLPLAGLTALGSLECAGRRRGPAGGHHGCGWRRGWHCGAGRARAWRPRDRDSAG